MHPHLETLPKGLLQHLGRLIPPDVLAQDLFDALHPHTPLPVASVQDLHQKLLQHPSNEFHLRLHGMDLKLQSHVAPAGARPETPPETPPETQPQWGLHSISLHARHHKQKTWAGPWPKDLDPDKIRPEQLVGLLAKDPEHALCVAGLVSFAIDGIDGQDWALSAVFDATSQLQNLHLMRLGDWRTGHTARPLLEAGHG